MSEQFKPYKGRIDDWVKVPIPKSQGEGYIIYGKPIDHPYFIDWIRTSPVVKRDGNEVETNNSRYTLLTPAKE